jgi:hypothetical protein
VTPPRLSSRCAIGVREQDDRLFGVIDDAVGEVGLVVGDQLDAVLPGMSAAVTTTHIWPKVSM